MAVLAASLLAQAEEGFLALLRSSLGRNQVLFLPVIVFAIACAVRRVRQVSLGTVEPESVPPKEITPAESGMLLRESVGSREVAATLVDLSVRKYLSITDTTPEMEGTPREHDLVFRALKGEAEWQTLAPHEKTVMRQAFRDNDWIKFSQLRKLLPEIVPAIQEQTKNSLWEKGLTRSDPNRQANPRWKIFVYVASLMGMLDGLVAGKTVWGLPLYEYPGLAFLMIAITMGIVAWGVQDPSNLTQKGSRTRTYLEGLGQFILAVDADRLQRLGRDRFDELLPYALVLGIEEKWASTLQGLAVQPLAWTGDEKSDSLLRGGRLTILSGYL